MDDIETKCRIATGRAIQARLRRLTDEIHCVQVRLRALGEAGDEQEDESSKGGPSDSFSGGSKGGGRGRNA